jgi:hypothetical protein
VKSPSGRWTMRFARNASAPGSIGQCVSRISLNKKQLEGPTSRSLLRFLESSGAEQATYPERARVVWLVAQIASLVDRMRNEIASEPLYAIQPILP